MARLLTGRVLEITGPSAASRLKQAPSGEPQPNCAQRLEGRVMVSEVGQEKLTFCQKMGSVSNGTALILFENRESIDYYALGSEEVHTARILQTFWLGDRRKGTSTKSVFNLHGAHFPAPETPQRSGGILIENNSCKIVISRSIIIGCGDARCHDFPLSRSDPTPVRPTTG